MIKKENKMQKKLLNRHFVRDIMPLSEKYIQEPQDKLKPYLSELELWTSKSTTNIQKAHVKAQIHLNRNIKQIVQSKKVQSDYEPKGKSEFQNHNRLSYPHVKHTASIWQRVGVGLLQVLAGAGNVEGYAHHLEFQFLGCFKQVPSALQREAKGHAGLCGVGLGGQLQQ